MADNPGGEVAPPALATSANTANQPKTDRCNKTIVLKRERQQAK